MHKDLKKDLNDVDKQLVDMAKKRLPKDGTVSDYINYSLRVLIENNE